MNVLKAKVDFAGAIWQPTLAIILLYLLLSSYQLFIAGNTTDAFFALVASITFIIFIVVEVLAKYVYYSRDYYPIKKLVNVYSGDNKLAGFTWLVTFIVFLFLTGGVFNILGFQSQSVFSQAASQITDPVISWSITNIFAPVAEEAFFLIGIPLVFFGALAALAKDIKFLNNVWIQIGLVALIVSPIFALFHIQNQALTYFIIAAILFRAVMIIGVWGDKFRNLIPFYQASLVAAIAAHMANNINSSGGLSVAWKVLSSSILGWVILIVFFLMPTLFAFQYITQRKSVIA